MRSFLLAVLVLLPITLLAGCSHTQEQARTPCQEWRDDVQRVCAHQGRDCGKTVCAGETITIKL